MHVETNIAIGGENLIDTVQSATSDGDAEFTHNLGGSPYNVSVALARQGTLVHYLTPISTDDFGERLAENLISQKVLIAGGRRDEPTTQAVVTLNEGVPTYVFHRDNTAERCVSVGGVKAAMPKSATHLHVGSLAFAGGDDADVWEEAFHAAAKSGLTTSLDPNVRASLIDDPKSYRARLMRLFASATIVKLSDEDLAWIYPDLTQSEAIDTLLSVTKASLLALTKGPDGAECWTSGLHCAVDNPPLPNLVDTIGAGDTFMATILASLAANNQLSANALGAASAADLCKLLERGVQAACLNCTKEGCDPPTSTAIDDAMARGTK